MSTPYPHGTPEDQHRCGCESAAGHPAHPAPGHPAAPAGGYPPAAPAPAAPAAGAGNTLAVTGLVLGGIALLLPAAPQVLPSIIPSIAPAAVGLALSITGLTRARVLRRGRAVAIWGIVLSSVALYLVF